MSKDRLKDSENKYWEGKSSLEEEKHLKATRDDAYFGGLKAAKEDQLKWTFRDFLHQTNLERPEKTLVPKWTTTHSLWKYVGVTAALLIVGLLFLKNWTTEPINEDNEVYVEQKPTQTRSLNLSIKEDSIFETGKEDTSLIAPQRERRQQENEESEPHHPRVEIIEESYVMVNGRPVYDEEEAERIVLASLLVMANNFQEGREAMEKIKHLKIEL